jgi:signal transduction histidine kinase
MDSLKRLYRRAKAYIFIAVLLNNLLLVGIWIAAYRLLFLNNKQILALLIIVAIAESILFALALTGFLMQPIRALWQSVFHMVQGNTDSSIVSAPQIEKLHFGRELVANLSAQIYQMINVADNLKVEESHRLSDLSNNFIAQNLPLPMLVLDQNENIKFVNQATANYLGNKKEELEGKSLYGILDMSFPSDDTFDKWLDQSKADTATAIKSWERVKLGPRESSPGLIFDMAAYYNRDNPLQNEIVLVLFDHTKLYSQDEQAISFVALSVHELRTPLTLLRGYIEVLEDELGGTVSPELQSFMEKMHSQAEQLSAFVNNILNVARIDDDQLELNLQEADWAGVLRPAIEALSLRAKVRGITLHCRIAQGLPSVAVDRLSVQEVINNLIDNAIKYSGKNKIINITTYRTKDGMVETTVQDYGLGISTSLLPNLFTKFYRDHHNRAQIGGTGLGLYLSHSIIKAHGGILWVKSKVGEGSTFGFTLMPYTELSEEAKKSGDKDIVRSAHGWIKNHSLYRR